MRYLLRILSKTELLRNGNTEKVLSRAIRNQFDQTRDRQEAETLILLAHKYRLSILQGMLNDLNYTTHWDTYLN